MTRFVGYIAMSLDGRIADGTVRHLTFDGCRQWSDGIVELAYSVGNAR